MIWKPWPWGKTPGPPHAVTADVKERADVREFRYSRSERTESSPEDTWPSSSLRPLPPKSHASSLTYPGPLEPPEIRAAPDEIASPFPATPHFCSNANSTTRAMRGESGLWASVYWEKNSPNIQKIADENYKSSFISWYHYLRSLHFPIQRCALCVCFVCWIWRDEQHHFSPTVIQKIMILRRSSLFYVMWNVIRNYIPFHIWWRRFDHRNIMIESI